MLSFMLKHKGQAADPANMLSPTSVRYLDQAARRDFVRGIGGPQSTLQA